MRRIPVILGLMLCVGCAPAVPRLHLTEICPAPVVVAEVMAGHWLFQPDVWRLRQSVLVEIRGKKLPMEGVMLLDLVRQHVHLVALNEMGIVLFELLVTATDEKLLRAVPQLAQQPGLARGIATSLRQIYLMDPPRHNVRHEPTGVRSGHEEAQGGEDFLFDCSGFLREVRTRSESSNWQVLYRNYREVQGRFLPEVIMLTDVRQGVRLTLRQMEATISQ